MAMRYVTTRSVWDHTAVRSVATVPWRSHTTLVNAPRDTHVKAVRVNTHASAVRDYTYQWGPGQHVALWSVSTVPVRSVTTLVNAAGDHACQCGPAPHMPVRSETAYASAVRHHTCQCGPSRHMSVRSDTTVPTRSETTQVRAVRGHRAMAVRDHICQSGRGPRVPMRSETPRAMAVRDPTCQCGPGPHFELCFKGKLGPHRRYLTTNIWAVSIWLLSGYLRPPSNFPVFLNRALSVHGKMFLEMLWMRKCLPCHGHRLADSFNPEVADASESQYTASES